MPKPRYITPELKEYEERVLAADEKSKELEYALFLGLREAVAASRRQVQQTAAVLSQDRRHGGPGRSGWENGITAGRTVGRTARALDFVDGRHPVLDVAEPDGTFVPNDVGGGRRGRV